MINSRTIFRENYIPSKYFVDLQTLGSDLEILSSEKPARFPWSGQSVPRLDPSSRHEERIRAVIDLAPRQFRRQMAGEKRRPHWRELHPHAKIGEGVIELTAKHDSEVIRVNLKRDLRAAFGMSSASGHVILSAVWR